MNAMTEKLIGAGVKIPPMTQRIWTWLKDKGPHGYKDVCAALKIPPTSGSSTLTQMAARKMLRKTEEFDTRQGKKIVKYEAIGNEYVLRPKPGKKSKAVSPSPVLEAAPSPQFPRLVFAPATFVQDLTMREAKQVYDYLVRVFK